MKLVGFVVLASTAFLGCHGEPKEVAREYLTALANGHHVEARALVIEECHEAPEGQGTLITQLGTEVRHVQIELRVEDQTDEAALVAYTVRGQFHQLQHGTTSSLEQAAHDNHPVHRSGQLYLVHDHEGWHVSCPQ